MPSPTSRPGLSPSRANDFQQCPLLFRFRVVDKLPQPPSEAMARGTLVHAVLERLYDAPASARTADTARALLPGEWDRLRAAEQRYADLFTSQDRVESWLASAGTLIDTYFTLEDPLSPAGLRRSRPNPRRHLRHRRDRLGDRLLERVLHRVRGAK